MDTIKVRGAERTPEIDFDFNTNRFRIAGESYPENVAEFYGDFVNPLREHLNEMTGQSIKMNFEFVYFNSSTARVIMELFDLMEDAAVRGNDVKVEWIYPDDDEYMQEIGEEFGADLKAASFVLKEIP